MQLLNKDELHDVLNNPTRENFRVPLQNHLGEEDYLDFKKGWPEKEKEARHILAMANSGGGCIVFGVMQNYICKIATVEEMNTKWDYEISKATNDKDNWIIWKKQNIKNYKNGKIIPYYGILEGQIICEATAALTSDVVQNSDKLVDDTTVYLTAFRTNKEYEGKGYFSKLYKFMEEDLKNKGYTLLTLGVEPEEIRNKEIYNHYGFVEHIKNAKEVYPDGTEIDVEYYGKKLK